MSNSFYFFGKTISFHGAKKSGAYAKLGMYVIEKIPFLCMGQKITLGLLQFTFLFGIIRVEVYHPKLYTYILWELDKSHTLC